MNAVVSPVVHINLLQRHAPAHMVAWTLATVLVLTLGGLGYYGSQVLGVSGDATRRRDEVARQLTEVRERMVVLNNEKARQATSIALSAEIVALQPQAQVAQGLVDAVRAAEGGRGEQFARTLAALSSASEPGLWLTSVTLASGGKKVELLGSARNGAAVLRFARRVNDALQPLALRLDTLEMQPAAAGAAADARTGAGAVGFRLN